MAKGKLALGLDIGSSSVKMILLKETKRGYELASFGMAPLPQETIVDGALMNSSAVVAAIQELLGAQRVKQREVALGLSGHSVIIKKIQMAQMSKDELDESIQWEAEQYIPFDVNDVHIDTQILRHDAADGGQMEVLLVAAKKDMINDYSAVVTEAGLQPVVVDVDAFAVQNTYEVTEGALSDAETIVLINAGASVVNVNVVANGVTAFTRDITVGGNLFTEEIQKNLNVSYEEAEALKIGGRTTDDAEAVVPQEVERVLSAVAEQVAGEIQRSLDFYASTAVDGRIAKVVLSGGTARIPALRKALEYRVGVPVTILDPFAKIEVDEKRFDPGYLAEVGPMAAVAVGLGLRRAGD